MSKTWTDESGLEIPVSRISKTEKLREKYANRMLKKAQGVSEALEALKAEVVQMCDEVQVAVFEENGVDPENRKGNFTWYNFDRSIKVEVEQSSRIDFDDTLITVAKEKFDEFLNGATGGVDEMIRTIILDAFETTRGKLDAKRVVKLLSYRERVPASKYPLFHEAANLIEKSIRRPESKQYVRISKKDGEGKYQPVSLNFSSI